MFSLSSLYDVIVTVGGEETLAAITGFTSRHVLIWRNRGWFPAVTYPQIRYNLLARGLDVDTSLFGPPHSAKNYFRIGKPPQIVAF
jgi:hypothetical protein